MGDERRNFTWKDYVVWLLTAVVVIGLAFACERLSHPEHYYHHENDESYEHHREPAW